MFDKMKNDKNIYQCDKFKIRCFLYRRTYPKCRHTDNHIYTLELMPTLLCQQKRVSIIS